MHILANRESLSNCSRREQIFQQRDAEKLEAHLKANPDDEEARVQLLSYYAAPPAGADLSTLKATRAKHILWLIENDPKDGLGLFQVATGVYRLHCAGDDLVVQAVTGGPFRIRPPRLRASALAG